MKLNLLLAAAVMAASSASFASIDNGDSEMTMTGGELILAAWDDNQKKSILFDTGVTMKQLVDNKDADVATIVNLNAIDPGYKSFFNNNLGNVHWNAYVGSYYTNGAQYDDVKYFGLMYTSKNPDFEVANPLDPNSALQNIAFYGDRAITFNQNAVGDTSATSVNRSYRVSAASDLGYLGNLSPINLWGSNESDVSARGTDALVGEKIQMVWNGAVNNGLFDTGVVTKFANAQFDATTDTFRVNTPLPAAAWLLMSGIAGFGAIARRRKQQA